MDKQNLKIRKVLEEQKKSKAQRYQELIIGRLDRSSLLKYEFVTTLSSWIPGALGLFLRSKFYPWLLGGVGRNVIFGANVTLRHPHKIFIGDDVVIDDNCLLDAKGYQNEGIFIGNGVFLGRNSILSCKDGDIHLEDGANIGFNCEVFSSSSVRIGRNTLIAAYCYLIGGGSYDIDQADITFAEQDGFSKEGGIIIGQNVWLAAGVKVLDGVEIGEGSVVGAGAVVRQSVPAFSVAAGVPARVLRQRRLDNTSVKQVL